MFRTKYQKIDKDEHELFIDELYSKKILILMRKHLILPQLIIMIPYFNIDPGIH